ncbi:transposase family protein [Amycolatopsis sp. DG1A-15b]|uniref:transposase family protein n=1 Tax=Amycolatopsis sp. DG1A-15b TaxID=3052846 RepID=UPI00255BA123|nr:transposase family protein [Amycolatopsis sp. DG1A-15b]WIX88976.1 transposase family protein [Amycolatopsis sp. DG1A-15b]
MSLQAGTALGADHVVVEAHDPVREPCLPLHLLPFLPVDRLASADLVQVADLREYPALVPDPRQRRGVRHSLASILALAAAAVAAGAQSFTAVGEWAADAPQRVLARPGTRFDPRRDRHVAPDEATMRRVLYDINGDDLDAAISGWITTTDTPPAIAVDGKSLRGTFARTGGAGVHLLSALTHHNGTWTQPLLDTLGLTGVVVTADALHTTRGLARYLTRRDAHYVFTVKETSTASTPGSPRCPGHKPPATPAPGSGTDGSSNAPPKSCSPPRRPRLPRHHAGFQITRYRTDRTTGTRGTHIAYGITSLPASTGPAHIALHLHRHWEIENRLHWVRDTAYREDASRVRTGTAPRAMATLRNLASAHYAPQATPASLQHCDTWPETPPGHTLRNHHMTSTNDFAGTPTLPGGVPRPVYR